MRGLAARQAEAAEVGADLERLGDVAADPGGEEFGDGADLLGVAVGDGPRRWWPGSPPSTIFRSR